MRVGNAILVYEDGIIPRQCWRFIRVRPCKSESAALLQCRPLPRMILGCLPQDRGACNPPRGYWWRRSSSCTVSPLPAVSRGGDSALLSPVSFRKSVHAHPRFVGSTVRCRGPYLRQAAPRDFRKASGAFEGRSQFAATIHRLITRLRQDASVAWHSWSSPASGGRCW